MSPKNRQRKKTARRFFIELLEKRVVLASDWQNPLWNLDVDFDGTVSPLDALVPINEINRQRDGGTKIDFTQPVGENNYLDVDGDLALSPIDILNVINYLNAIATPLPTDLSLSVDSGRSATDKITNNPTVIGSVFDFSAVKPTVKARFDRGPVVPLSIAGDNTFVFDTSSGSPILDGNRYATFFVQSDDGSIGYQRLWFTLDTTAPVAPSLVLSAASGLVSSLTSNAGRVTLVGTTDPGEMVTLVENASNTLANTVGNFQFQSVSLSLGDNAFTTKITDVAGNTGQTSTTIERVSAPSSVDPVLSWNQTLLQAVRGDASDPTRASRDMAMVHAAIYDAVNAIEGRSGYYVTMAAPDGVSLEGAISGAAHQVLTYLFPTQRTLLDGVLATSLTRVPDGPTKLPSVEFGRQIGDAIIALRANDGWDKFVEHTSATEPGSWQPTAPLYAVALDPQWTDLQPWVMTTPDQFLPPGPPSLASVRWADAYNETKTLGSRSSTVRTADQTQVARFWADGTGTSTPPGHWNVLAEQIAAASGNSISENARLFAMLDITLADAAIVAFNAKYTDDFWRPITAIRNGDTDDNDLTIADSTWQPFLATPAFPEYVSGHSTFSGAAAAVMTALFGNQVSFSVTSEGLSGVSRSFANFDAAAAEAGRSRIYGGIHYEFSNADGLSAGRKLAQYVLRSFDTSTDTIAPRVIFDAESGRSTSTNPKISGRVIDNVLGVRSLTVSVNGGPVIPVSFDAQGRFTFNTSLPLSGLADGSHSVSFIATDAGGNASNAVTRTFTLDTIAPNVVIQSPTTDGTIDVDTLLTGTVGTEGSPIVALGYSFSGQPIIPIKFSSQTGEFNARLELSKLAPGATVLTIRASDAAGNTTTKSINLSLATRIPFNIDRYTPLNGAVDVGTTYRPQVFFSRPVNPTSLTSANFYATGPSGAKLPANIVPSGDGSFAWLFFTQPMPSSSRITVHLDGSTILAAGDAAMLDADNNGTALGQLSFDFSTVSLTPLIGTSLSGKVLDVGGDLKPMTFDDVRVGPDQVINTADDVFLLPIAGAKVFIVGLENQFVLTDAQGNFRFDSVPAGNVKLAIDGRTATNASAGTFFPEMVMDLNLEAGRANTVMGTMGTLEQQAANRERQEVYLPRLQTSILQNVSGAAPTLINVGADAAQNITPEQRAMLTLQVQPGSMRDQNGNLVAAGQVGISTVPASLVREMLPPGLLQHTFDITVQSPGVTNFATPAPMTFPNLFGAKPGEQLNFLSFDHTTGRLVIEGSATVSADGLSVSTNPGTGITHPGWHGLTPQGSPTRPDNKDDNVAALGTEFSYSIKSEVVSDRPADPAAVAARGLRSAQGVGDHLLVNSSERIRFSVTNDTNLRRSDGSYVRVEFTTADPKIAHDYLDGLKYTVFKLFPGVTANFDFTIKTRNILKLTNDELIGVKYHLEVTKVSKFGVKEPLPQSGDYYAYRYVDAMDDNPSDGILRFAPTINDGAGGHVRTRPVEFRGDPAAFPKLEYVAADPANPHYRIEMEPLPPRSVLTFDPTQTAKDRLGTLSIKTPEPNSRIVTRSSFNPFLTLIGSGVAPKDLYFNMPGLENELKRLLDELVNGQTRQQVELAYIERPDVDNSMMKFKLEYGTQPRTSELTMASTDREVQTALEAVTGGPGSVTVTASNDVEIVATGPNKGKTRVFRRYLVTIPLQNSTPAKLPVKLDVVHTGGNFGERIDWNVNDATSRISPNEYAMFFTDADRRKFADAAFHVFNDAFQSFVDRGEIVIHPEGLPGADYNVNWTSSARDLFGLDVGVSVGYEKLEDLVRTRTKFNPAQQSYLLAEARDIEHKGQNGGPTGIEAYVDNHFEFFYPFWDAPFDIVTQELGFTAAHELGHALGLPHSSNLAAVNFVDEVQRLVLSDGAPGDTFVLDFAGELTGTIPQRTDPIAQDASALEVQEALQKLPTFRDIPEQVRVEGLDGGPFEIRFADRDTSGIPQMLRGARLPLLRGFGTGNLIVTASPSVLGGFDRKVTFDTVTFPTPTSPRESSSTDIMNSGNAGVPLKFQDKVSGAGLRFGARGDWTISDAQAYISFLIKLAASGRKLNFSRDVILKEGDEPLDPFDFTISGGSLLELFDEGSQLIPDTTDFGQASTFVPSVRHFSLTNLGSENATVRSVGITKGNAVFSLPTIPVTVVAPGKSLDFDVTFAPDSILSYEGTLSINSDVDGFRGEFDLIGDGHPPSTPSIKLDFYNNLQGVRVGELTSFSAAGRDNHPKLTNVGSAPLTITEIRVAAGQGFGEWMTPALAAPITLAPGESTGIAMSFRASKTGLRPGAFDVLSNDPRKPLLRVPVVATGVITNDNYFTYEGLDLGNDYVVVGDMLSYNNNLPDLRTKSDDAGHWEFFLPASTGILVTTYDPMSGLISSGNQFTSASGIPTLTNNWGFAPSVAPDTDGDGLPDDIEFAIGTNPNQLDTDADGTNDFAELDSGLNPMDDRPSANGIVSALPTGSTALDIKLAADFRDPSRSLAYVASGNSGLTIVDVNNFARPITISQLSAPGVINNLSLDVVRKLLAASSPTNGVHLIDVADPSRPTLLRTLPHEGTDPVAAVELYDGIVYVGVGGKIRAFDVQSGELSSDFDLGTQRVLGMSRSGDRLYATLLDTASSQRLLRIFDISTAGLTARGSVVLPGITAAGDPYFTNDIERLKDIIIQTPAGPIVETVRVRSDVVWIPAGDRVVTVDVANPLTPEIITSAATIAQGGAADIELNGSGLAVVAGFVNPGGSAIVLQTPYPNNTNQIFTRFTLPSFGQAIALSSGLAYVADGASGLQLVNFLQRDTGLTPPTIGLNPLAGDINPSQAGVQLFEGATITLGNRITDDVQVRKVELLVDGTVVRTELSYPYELTTVLPTIAQTGNQAVLQVRATDTGGNSTLSAPIVIDVLADTTAPTISAIDPPNGSTQPISRRKVTIKFSEALDRSTVVPANFVLQGPSGPISPISMDLRQRDTQIEILYPPLAQGAYTFVTHAAAVKDRAGNALGAADVSSTFTVAAAVFAPTIRWVNEAGGQWADASNWRDVATNLPRVPATTDDVKIDVPTDAQITLSTGVITVHSVVSNERFQITGGQLNVTDTIQVNNTFLLRGPDPSSFSNLFATLSGTVLRGVGGEGLTIGRQSRLVAATLQTDVTINEAGTILRVAGGLAIEGTLTIGAPNVRMVVDGTQTWSSGTIVTTGATPASALMNILSAGNSTLTIGQDFTLRAQVQMYSGNGDSFGSGLLSVINRGTITALASTPATRFGVFTRTESFTNYGTINTLDRGSLSIEDKTFVNTATGRIKISSGQQRDGLGGGALGKDNTTNFTNAGTIELVNTTVNVYGNFSSVNHVFSNTGTITNDKSLLTIYGSYTSADVANIPNTGIIIAGGVLDNTGRTFTYSNTVGVFSFGGRTLGGTIVKSGLAELFLNGTLVGVTLEGDFNSSEFYTDPIKGDKSFRTMNVSVEQGLTLRGTISFYKWLASMTFVGGPQAVSGGTIQFLPSSYNTVGRAALQAITGGPVTLDSTLTIRSGSSGGGGETIFGNFISNATIVIDANSSLSLGGLPSANAITQFINRGTITLGATRTLNAFSPFTNEGQINVSGGTLNIDTQVLEGILAWKNTGVINQSNGLLAFRAFSGGNNRKAKTADLGNMNVTGGVVYFQDDFELDNTGATLVIGPTSQWYVLDGRIVGGTIQVDATAKFGTGSSSTPGLLKDVTVNGNTTFFRSALAIAGDIDFKGKVTGVGILQLGHATLYAGVPLIIRGGDFDLGLASGGTSTITGTSGPPSVTLGADVVLRGRKVNATFAMPLTNRGQIIADQQFPFPELPSELFSFTAAPITNEGTLSAVNRAILRIANLAAPNSGIVSAGAGSSVEFTGTFAQASTGTTRIDIGGTAIDTFGLVAVTGAATLDGTLEVQFASGFTPAVGSSFKVLTYASKIGTFATVNVTGLASGLKITPQYNGSDMTLVVSAG